MGRIKSDPPPRTQRADVPDSLERLLRQAMAKDPAARPQSAMELIRGLQSIEQELRLPLTQPILPADIAPGAGASPVGPGRHAATPPRDLGTDTWSRTSGGGTTFVRGVPGAGAAPGAPDRAAAWAGGAHRADAWSPAAAEDAETRARGARRIDPWSSDGTGAASGTGGSRGVHGWSAGAGENAETLARGPRRVAPWPEAEPGGRGTGSCRPRLPRRRRWRGQG